MGFKLNCEGSVKAPALAYADGLFFMCMFSIFSSIKCFIRPTSICFAEGAVFLPLLLVFCFQINYFLQLCM